MMIFVMNVGYHSPCIIKNPAILPKSLSQLIDRQPFINPEIRVLIMLNPLIILKLPPGIPLGLPRHNAIVSHFS